MRVCSTCRWAVLDFTTHEVDGTPSDEAEPVMLCRRYPPKLLVLDTDRIIQVVPHVTDDDVCGEWTAEQEDT